MEYNNNNDWPLNVIHIFHITQHFAQEKHENNIIEFFSLTHKNEESSPTENKKHKNFGCSSEKNKIMADTINLN